MKNFRTNKSSRNQMHSAVCSECGDHCQVPFKPTSGKPIFCSNCFEKKSGNRVEEKSYREPRFNSRGSDRNQMHDAVCAECGKDCKVPFKPSNDRPIYCSDCFEARGNGSRKSRGSNFTPKRGSNENYKKDFQVLNKKLDMILELLTPKKEVVEIEEIEVEEVKPEETKKKVEAKKTVKETVVETEEIEVKEAEPKEIKGEVVKTKAETKVQAVVE